MIYLKQILTICLLGSVVLSQEVPIWRVEVGTDISRIYTGQELGGLEGDGLIIISNGNAIHVPVNAIQEIQYDYIAGTEWKNYMLSFAVIGFVPAFMGSYEELGSVVFSLYAGSLFGLAGSAIGALLGSFVKKTNTLTFTLSHLSGEEKIESVRKIYVLWKSGALVEAHLE